MKGAQNSEIYSCTSNLYDCKVSCEGEIISNNLRRLRMTSNQIAYWSLQEQQRANEAKEKETERSNRAKERETSAHNRATEKETVRSNKVSEGQRDASISSQIKTDKVKRGVDIAQTVINGVKTVGSLLTEGRGQVVAALLKGGV